MSMKNGLIGKIIGQSLAMAHDTHYSVDYTELSTIPLNVS